MNSSLVFGGTLEQKELAFNEDGEKKAYTDCEGYADFMERMGITKEDADYHAQAVDSRLINIETNLMANPEMENASGLKEEYECLEAIRATENDTDTTLELEDSTGSLNYIPYSNTEQGISFEYPSDWDLKEKTSRFASDPEVMVGNGFNDFKFLGHDEAIDDMLDSFDLEFVASTMQSSALESESNTRLVEGVTEFENVNIGGVDGPIMTFLYTSTNPLFEGLDTNLQGIGEIARQIFLVENDDKVYTLGYSNYASDFDSPESQEIMHHILNTFQFIDSSSVSESEEENEDEDNENN